MIGVHIRSRYSVHHFMPVLERFNNGRGPDAILVVDPKDGDGDLLRSRFPAASLVGRVFVPDGEASNAIMADPGSAALRAANNAYSAAIRGNNGFHWWQWNNEILQRGVQIDRLNAFTIEYLNRLAVYGLKGAIGCFSRGNPEAPQLDNGADWKRFYPAMLHGMKHGAILLLHAYGAPGMLHDATWHLHRYEALVRPHLPDDLKAMPYLYGEYGAERPEGRREAWKAHYPSAAAYVADMRTAAHTLAQIPECRGACIYNLEGSPPVDLDWLDFEIAGEVIEQMAQVAWPKPATIPPVSNPEPPTEPEPDVRIIDMGSTHSSNRAGHRVKKIIVHSTVTPLNGSLESTARYLVRNERQVSIHELVGGNTVYRMVPDSLAAHHAWSETVNIPGVPRNLANLETWGIEGLQYATHPTAPDVVQLMVERAALACKRHNLTAADVLSHGEVDPTRRSDPVGVDMNSFRARVAALLAPAPIPVPVPVPVPSLQYGKVAWALEQSARVLKSEGWQAEHDHLLASEVYKEAVAKR